MAILFCKKCQQHLDESLFAMDKARSTGRRYRCRVCSAEEYENWKTSGGYEKRLKKTKAQYAKFRLDNPKLRWAKQTVYNVNARSKRHGQHSHDITLEWLLSVMPDKCPLLGIDLNYANDASYYNSPAIDRKDNSKSYTIENCWVISMKANRIKNNGTQKEIEMVAENLKRLGIE